MIKNTSLFTLLVVTAISLFSCGSDTQKPSTEPFGNCKYGPPKAIFTKEIPRIVSHDFQLNPLTAVENVVFDDKILLELTQSGCEKPKQEFQFTLPLNSKGMTDENWIDLSLDMFSYMGGLSESLQPFLFWYNALKEKKAELKLGLPQELEQGHFVKLDKIASEETGIIIITIYQE